jgi:hypothetical protein
MRLAFVRVFGALALAVFGLAFTSVHVSRVTYAAEPSGYAVSMAPVVTTAGQDYGSAMAASGVTPAGCDFYDSWCNYCVTHAGSSLCAGYVARLAGSAAARPR